MVAIATGLIGSRKGPCVQIEAYVDVHALLSSVYMIEGMTGHLATS